MLDLLSVFILRKLYCGSAVVHLLCVPSDFATRQSTLCFVAHLTGHDGLHAEDMSLFFRTVVLFRDKTKLLFGSFPT